MTRAWTHALATAFGLAGVLSSAACGDVYADPEGETAAFAGAGTITDAAASAVFPAAPPPQCPSTRPRENTTCGVAGSTCEYGKSADRQCNSMLACVSSDFTSVWESRASDPCFAAACPVRADVASIDGKPCSLESDRGAITDADEAACNMTDGVCACTTGRDGMHAHARSWSCIRPLSACPPTRPLAGQPCQGALWCDYGSCLFKRGVVMECENAIWVTGGASCQ
jgi:hypothetical protein